MKISYNWLKEYIKTDLPPEKVSEILTNTGLEVEGLEEIETVKGGLKGVIIGKVLTCEPHPNADRLRKTTVDINKGEPLHIVCGAPNVAAGQKVPVATVGTIIYTEEGDFTIKKSKIRGEVSEGMICAEDELGLGQSHDGIMVLDDSAEIGTTAAEYFKIESDYVFEIGLTPNRTDAMGHYGVARDLRAALLRQGEENVELSLPSVSSFKVSSTDLPIDIEIEDTEACPRYAGVSLKNVRVEPSPDWLQNRLRAIGIGPINNIVDITNYVLHETGHPLHAFDADEITGYKVVVKHLPAETKFITLDEKERSLHENDLMICNEQEGMVIAGVLGGLKSGVTEKTTRVFIESAYFNPVGIRKTAKRHGLNTDASYRYERGVDPNMSLYTLKRAALLMCELSGGEIAMDIKDVYSKPIEDAEVSVNLDRINRLIGQEIEIEQVRSILSSLDIKIKAEAGRDLMLAVPPYRADVTREADIVEEILRIYGFNAIELRGKMDMSVNTSDPLSERQYREKISSLLSSRGFNEIMNNSLTKSTYYEGYGFNIEESVEILNPLSQDLGVLRQSMLFGGLEVVAYNSNRQQTDLCLYEFGKVYRKNAADYHEEKRLSLWRSGLQKPENWRNGSVKTDFYYLKAEIDNILKNLGFSRWEERETAAPIFDYGLNLYLNNREIAILGKLKTDLARKTEVKQEVFYADLDWEYLSHKGRKNDIIFEELPKYPEVRRDLALLLDKAVKYIDLKNTAEKTERKLLRNVNLFDVYEGKNLPSGKKSYALSFTLRDDNKTLNDQQVDKIMSKVLATLEKEHGAMLR